MSPGLEPHVERFRQAVRARLGLAFDDARTNLLAEVLLRRADVTGLSVDRYVTGLEETPSVPELGPLASELTVGETYVFRHGEQLRAFAEVAVPSAMAARGRLAVLSAGCATGEEPYTLAMLAEAAGVRTSSLDLTAIDVNPAALERARGGRYTAWALRETSSDVQHRWFRVNGHGVIVNDAIRQAVRFEERNLAVANPSFWAPARWDVVFCRNVLMYFDPPAAAAVISRITGSLVEGGHLFLGHAETLRGLSNDYHLCHTHGAFYYRRKGTVAAPDVRTPRPPSVDLPPLADGGTGWIDAIQRASDRVRHLTGPGGDGATSAPSTRPPDADTRLLDAVALVDRGEGARADGVCRELLAADELNAGAHYVLALCREASGDPQAAMEHDQMAAYLDPGFAMPRLHLGLSMRRAGHHDAARRELAQALFLLDREDTARQLLFGGGFGRDSLITLCRAELAACGGRP